MKITLLGYMASGKSTIGSQLATDLGFDFIDLDQYIESKENTSIYELIKKTGEIKFRKIEHQALKEILNLPKNTVIALGGGTPVYYNNMELISENSKTVYLRLSPSELSRRLENEKEKRPLIAHIDNENLTEFIAKHLFERRPFYEKSILALDVKDQSAEQLSREIIHHFFPGQ